MEEEVELKEVEKDREEGLRKIGRARRGGRGTELEEMDEEVEKEDEE